MIFTRNLIDHNLYQKNDKIKRIAITVVMAILLLFINSAIFSFSEQDAEASGSLSLNVAEKIIEFIDGAFRFKWTRSFMDNLAVYFEHPLRKAAHFTEYAILGAVIAFLLKQWYKTSKGLYIFITFWVFLTAFFDELHQYFVPGRYASFFDVLLDTAGGFFGIFVTIKLFDRLLNRLHMRKF